MDQDQIDAILKGTQECIERMQKLAAETQSLLKDRERLQETALGQAFTDRREAMRKNKSRPGSN